MSLRIVSDSDLIVEAGLAVQLGYGGDYNHVFTHAVVLGYDPLLAEIIKGYFYLPLGLRRLSTLFRLSVPSDYRETSVSHVMATTEYNNRYDETTYATTFSGLGLFFDTLSGIEHRIPPYREKERNCRHNTLGGTVYPLAVDIPHSKRDYAFAGLSIPVRYNDGNTYYIVSVTGVNPLRINPIPIGFGPYFCHNLLDFLGGLPETVTINRFDHGYQIVKLSQLDFSVDCDAFVINYEMDVETFPSLANNFNDDHAWWHACISLPMGLQAGSFVSPSVSGTYATSRWQQGSYSYSNFRSNYAENGSMEYGPTDYTYVCTGEQRMFPIMLSIPTPAVELDDVGVSLRSNDLLTRFRIAVTGDWKNVTPAAIFSTADAVKDLERSLNVNILQNLQKLPDIASMMPAFKDAVKVLGKLAHRDLSLATLREIADLISQTELQRSFQWRPSLDVLKEYLPQLWKTIQFLGQTSENSLGYGKFRFELPSGSFGRTESRLVVRTKLVVDTSHRGLLSSLLKYDALGTIPKASNLWDLIPFSFAVNWFTGIGTSIRRAEYMVALLTLPAYYVHTYTITSPLTEEELHSYGFSSSTTSPAHLRLYYRDLSLYAPPVRDSRYGFGIPTQLPPLGTVASLLWQLIFAAK